MADPTIAEIAGNNSTAATTTVTFAAQPAGTLLHLSVAADDYRVLSGTNRPEANGWTYLDGREGNLGCYVWWKIATGSETSVPYQIGSASRSSYTLLALSNIDGTPLGVTAANASSVGTNVPTHTTPSLTPAAGSRWCVIATVGSTGNATAGPYTWAGSFTKRSERYHTAGYRPGVTTGTATVDGGSALQSTVTFASATNVNQGVAVVAAFEVVAASSTPGQGSGSGTLAWSGSATGKRAPKGSSSGTVAFSGTATGRTVRRGSGSGVLAFVGTATGKRAPKATGSGSLAFSGSASGSAPAVGSASGSGSGSLAWSGSATGKRSPKASTAGAVAWAGSATGRTTRRGTGSGGLSWSGSAVGNAPSVDGASGSGSGSLAWAGSAVGKRRPVGSGTGVLAYAGSAVGTSVRRGVATGQIAWLGAAVGQNGAPAVYDLTATPAPTMTVTAAPAALTVASASRDLTVAAAPPALTVRSAP